MSGILSSFEICEQVKIRFRGAIADVLSPLETIRKFYITLVLSIAISNRTIFTRMKMTFCLILRRRERNGEESLDWL